MVSWPWSSNLVYNGRPQWAITNKATLYRIILSLEKTPPFFPFFFLRGGGVFTQAICEIADVNRVPVYNCIRDGPLENLWGVRAKYKKNIRAREY